MSTDPARRLPPAFVAAVGAVLLAGVVTLGVEVHRVAGTGSPSGVPTAVAQASPSASPSPVPTPTPTAAPSATPVAAPCTGKSFGSPLPPKDAPANVHVYSAAPAMQIDTTKLYEATITTPRGSIVLCLEPSLAPKTVNNFVVLARNHFFDGLTFHRVEAGFVIQGGDPKGDGTGGPGYSFADEPVHGTYDPGTVAMANSGPNTNGSQFFICSGSQCSSLNSTPKYNLFGHVAAGFDVVLATQKGDVMTTVTVAAQT